MLHAGPHSPLIDRGDALEVLDRLVGGVRGRHLYAGVVERHIEPAVFCNRSVDGRGHLRFIGNVAGDADASAALSDDPRGLLRGKIPVKISKNHGGAALGEHPRRRQAHALAAPVTSATCPLKS